MEPTLFDYQQNANYEISKLYQQGNRKVLVILPGGGGKCLGINTPVLMYDGTIKKVQDIKTGDELMGDDSTPRNVLSTCIGYDELYKVIPIKGDSYIVNKDHILSLRIGSGEDNIIVCGKKYKAKDIVNISVTDYFKTTKWFRICAKGWRTSVEFYDSKLLEIDPYFLGFWLGDGNSNRISFTSGDIEIENYLRTVSILGNFDFRIEYNSKNSNNYHLSGGNIKELKNKFIKYNLFGNKHVPFDYKTSSRKKRLEILAGLMDSDGHLTDRSCFDFISILETIADDVCYLARSLGLAAYKNKCKKGCMYKGEYKEGDYYRVSISGHTDIIPCKIKRNQANERKMNKDVLYVGIKSVERIGFGEYYGFEIDGNRLFLLGDFTVTHNTILSGSQTKNFHFKQKSKIDFTFDYTNQTGKKVAFFTHREELFEQTREKFLRFGNITEPINADTSRINPNSDTFVAMVETFDRRSNSETFLNNFKNVGLVFIDEAHRTDFNKILHHFDQSLIEGLTATPISTDKKKPLNTIWNVAYEAATVTQLQQLNQQNPQVGVVPSDCYQLSGIDRSKLGKKGDDFDERKMSVDFRDKKQKQNTLEHYYGLGKGMKGLCFNVDIEHNEEMHLEFLACGIPSRMLHSDKKKFLGAPSSSLAKNWRRDTLLWLKNTPGAIVHNVGILTTGFDEPSIELILTNFSTLSISKYIQCIVRGARPYQYPNGEWKQFYRLLDFGQNAKVFGDGNNNLPWIEWFKNPASSSLKEGVGGYKSCPECGSLNPVAARFCMGLKEEWLTQEKIECGYIFPISEKQEDLVPRVMVKFFSDGINVYDLVKLAEMNGYKKESVYYRILDRISSMAKKSFGTYILSEQLNFLLDIAYSKLKELGKITGKRCWKEGAKKSLIERLKKDGFVLDVEEIGDSGVLEELKEQENLLFNI